MTLGDLPALGVLALALVIFLRAGCVRDSSPARGHGVVITGLLRSAHDADIAQPQLPLLGRGTWLVGIDEHGEMTRCEPHVCFDAAVRRLLDEERS